jgi:hypothetical protein
MATNITSITHPLFMDNVTDWEKYRLTYAGGRDFVDRYLKKYDARENDDDFEERKSITYCPCFAGAAIDEIKNAIFSRLLDVVRINPAKQYSTIITGNDGGVDLNGSSIDYFIGCEVLPELLITGRVGIYVDMPEEVPLTLKQDSEMVHPYFYTYRVEDIRSWSRRRSGGFYEFEKLLLRDTYLEEDDVFGLIDSTKQYFRYIERVPDGILVKFYTEGGDIVNEKIINIPNIPFVMLELSHSLLRNVADYQVALLNMESADVNFARKSNFPIYTEQITYPSNLPDFKPSGQDDKPTDISGPGQARLGQGYGRRYPKGVERPDFIHPSPEPLKVSMAKEDQIKRDIRLLVHLAVANLDNKQASAESKRLDNEGLENGLSLIAIVLENAEKRLMKYWNSYTNIRDEVQVAYPRRFDLRTDDERRKEVGELEQLMQKIPSDTFKREILKRMVDILFERKLTTSMLQSIHNEIDTAKALTSDPKELLNDLESGLVSVATASGIRGYRPGEVEQAKRDHEERLKRISEAQGGDGGTARGVDDLQVDQPTSSEEKQNKPGRGESKS